MSNLRTHGVAEIGVALGAGALVWFILSVWSKNRSHKKILPPAPRNWEPVAKVERLTVYPLKSCKGLEVDTVRVDGWVLSHGENVDRQFMMVNGDGYLVSGRTHPKCVLISAEVLPNNRLRLTAPRMPPCELRFPTQKELKAVSGSPQEVVCNLHGRPIKGLDMGPEVSQWLTDYLVLREGRGLDDGHAVIRMVFHHLAPGQRKPTPKEVEMLPLMSEDDKSLFQDTSNVAHLLSLASVDDLNERLKEIGSTISSDFFRPNIVVSGCDAYGEDGWEFLKIGDAIFRNTSPCTRCLFTTVDPVKGEKNENRQPLVELRKYRKEENPALNQLFGYSPKFGTMLSVEKTGSCSVGDVVYVGRSS